MPRPSLPTRCRRLPISTSMAVTCMMTSAVAWSMGCAQRSPEPAATPPNEPPLEAASFEPDLSRRPPTRTDSTGASAASDASAQSRPERFVELSLLASVPEAKAGQRLWVAAHFRIHESAHIYWQNPGEAGLATRATFHVPDGFRVGPVRYPGPERFETEPGVASFGYSGEAALLVELDVPESIDEPGQYPLEVEASWLSCSDICIKESASARSLLSVVTTTRDAGHQQTHSLERFVDQLPSPFSALPDANHRWSVEGNQHALHLTARGVALVDFFPTERPAMGEKLPRVQTTATSSTATGSTPTELRVSFGENAPRFPVQGVVRAEVGQRMQFFELEVARP